MIDFKNISKFSKRIKEEDFKLGGFLFGISLLIILTQLIYLNLRFNLLLEEIPLFYTKAWGEIQLAPKENIFIIPASSLIISLFGLLFFYYLSANFYRFGTRIVAFVVIFTNSFLTYSLFRIVTLSLRVSDPLISENHITLILLFIFSLIVSLLFSPIYVRIVESLGIVTDPEEHDHPAMILNTPSARGGGLFFSFLFGLLSLVLVSLNIKAWGIIFGSLILAVFGFLDDYQNTHPKSKLKILENPFIRLFFLFIFVSLLYFFGIKISFFTNPLDSFVYLNTFDFMLGNVQIQPLAWLFTTVWIVWILNFLSWSNGVDGQYSGIVGIALIFLSLLALRYPDLTPLQVSYSRMAIIAAGISFGLVGVTWYPSKIMWGFGAMSAGVVVASLSILIQAKVITSILILLIPFLDALVTIIRRFSQGRNPLRGDRGHLHHLLMDNGFSVPQVSLFYWFVTLLFGGLSLYSSERPLFQLILMILGIVFFVIVLGNLQLLGKKQPSQQPE